MDAKNVEVVADDKNHVTFKTTCQCFSDRHTVTVMVYRESYGIDVSLWFSTTWNDDLDAPWYRRFYTRLKTAIRVLFIGELTTENEFLFRNKEHIQEFTDTLEEAIKQVGE